MAVCNPLGRYGRVAADHSFEAELYPKCPPNKINYFYKNGLIATNAAELQNIVTANADKEFFSVKLLFPVTREELSGFGYKLAVKPANP